MPPGTLDFRDETPEAYEALRTMTDVPFAIGEEFASKWQFLPYVERGIAQFARIDVCNVGGLTEAMKVAGWCEAHYVDLMPAQPARTDLHGRDGAPGRGGAELRLDGDPVVADRRARLLRQGAVPRPVRAGRTADARAGSAGAWRRVRRGAGEPAGVPVEPDRASPAAGRIDHELLKARLASGAVRRG